ncbi:hypothetical protein DSM104443_02097 [Usitatibacter rugosus]|uniref:Leucine-binding protein domain-containing protein n=1 Tax=Usitatibacter rugosus TaxID=2732067 RepID=A0A6M4GV34_9PROT|nr:ABC transporter substrate-binding protein [Usitatibacter rugosus]QJR11026.1 hypothetical protein DSM104443_02097 [Usitatibacter rugosus]
MRRLMMLACAGMLSLTFHSHAQIKVGISGPLQGPNSGSMLEVVKGAEIYFNSVNDKGGIGGQKIQLLARDDNFEVDKTVAVVKKLVIEDKVTALLLVRGTPHNQAILPIIAEHKVPLIGPSTGAMVFHKPVNPYVFNVRTAYQLEAATLIDLLKTSGMQRISILYVDDGFGKDVLEGLKTGLATAKLQATAIVPFDRTLNSKDSIDIMKPSMTEALKGDPQIVIVVGAGLAVKNSLLAIRSSGSLATLATLSNNASTAFMKLLSPHGRGVIVSQVFPDERSLTSPFVREAQQTAFKAKVSLTPGMMEGYAAAKVLVQGLRGAGSSPTRASLVTALDSMKAFDLGDLVIGYSPTDHTGLEMTDLSMITKDKGFQR